MSTSSISSNSSAFSFCHLTSSLDDNVRKRDLRIQVPELKQQSYPLPNSNSQESPWKIGKLIYKGIYHAFNCENGIMCTMKEVSLSSDGDKNQSARMLEKVDGKFCIYYEYMSRGSIYMILEQYGRLGESAIRSYTQHILSGLPYMHSKSIEHGDIKRSQYTSRPKWQS